MSNTPKLARGVSLRLSLMMFLQYAIWGAWLPLLYQYLSNGRGFGEEQIGSIFVIGGVGALVAPFIAGQIADRYFATQHFLGISHLLGAALVWQLATLENYESFLWFSLAYSVIYMPTLALTNSLALHHIPDKDRDFGRVRTWGTVGWVIVGIAVGQWLLHHHTPDTGSEEARLAAQIAGMSDAFRVSAVLGACMGLYCFFLPNTPPAPAGEGERKSATIEALREIRMQPLLVLFLLAVPVSCIHQFYFVHTAGFLGQFQVAGTPQINAIFGVGGGGLMTVGQMSEMLVLMLIPVLAKGLSRKALLAIGLAAYALRMAIFAYIEHLPEGLQTPVLLLGLALHGLCFGCFIFVSFMIVDEETSSNVRASAQSLYNLVIVGLGIIVGSLLATEGAKRAKDADGVMNYQTLFGWPMWASLACLGCLFLLYPSKGKRK